MHTGAGVAGFRSLTPRFGFRKNAPFAYSRTESLPFSSRFRFRRLPEVLLDREGESTFNPVGVAGPVPDLSVPLRAPGLDLVR